MYTIFNSLCMKWSVYFTMQTVHLSGGKRWETQIQNVKGIVLFSYSARFFVHTFVQRHTLLLSCYMYLLFMWMHNADAVNMEISLRSVLHMHTCIDQLMLKYGKSSKIMPLDEIFMNFWQIVNIKKRFTITLLRSGTTLHNFHPQPSILENPIIFIAFDSIIIQPPLFYQITTSVDNMIGIQLVLTQNLSFSMQNYSAFKYRLWRNGNPLQK